ncbi:MAG: hypothetical protein QXQ02_06290 [Halobacteria archaeon]
MILRIIGNSDLKLIIDTAWSQLTKILNVPNDLSQYLINVFKELEKALNTEITVTIFITERYKGALIPTPENPSISFSLPSPEVIINKTVKGWVDIRISFYTPRFSTQKEEYIVLLKIVGHELFHMYLDLEFLKRASLTFSPGVYLVKPNNELVEVEEAVAESVSIILVKNALSKETMAILSLSKYARNHNPHVMNEVMSLGKVPQRILSILVKGRGIISCSFLG